MWWNSGSCISSCLERCMNFTIFKLLCRSRRVVGSNPIWDSDFFFPSPPQKLVSCCCCFIFNILCKKRVYFTFNSYKREWAILYWLIIVHMIFNLTERFFYLFPSPFGYQLCFKSCSSLLFIHECVMPQKRKSNCINVHN